MKQDRPSDATSRIPALEPTGAGHQFVFYGDCCSGIPDGRFESTFARVNAVVSRLDPQPEFIWFLGDHIAGHPQDADSLSRQWRHWLDSEMAWLDTGRTQLYHTTSNHDTPNAASEQVWREIFQDLLTNGPPGQERLSYWVRRKDLLLVSVNTSFSGLGGNGHVEHDWLEGVIEEHGDARHKLVGGHYPVFPVNGYDEAPTWRVVPDEGREFWSVLARYGVIAYLCSHVIAFDAQERDGVLQICSGGAGTSYGPGGFMGECEYHHAVQAVVDMDGFRLQTLDLEGRVRERLG